MINNLSERSYGFIEQHWPLPCYSTIYAATKNDVKNIEQNILNPDRVRSIITKGIKQLYDSKKCTDKIDCTLAVDAIATVPQTISAVKQEIGAVAVSGLEKQKRIQTQEKKSQNDVNSESESLQPETQLNNVFICYLEPLDTTFPCIPIHLIINDSGQTNKDVANEIVKIINIVQESKYVRIVNFSSDGDRGEQPKYNKLMAELLDKSGKTLDLDILLEKFKPDFKDFMYCCTDFLHFIKVVRRRFLLYKISLLVNSTQFISDPSLFVEVLGNGPEVTDESDVGKMRDIYAIKLFSPSNLIALFEHGFDTTALIFMPFVFWTEAQLNPLYDIEARIWLLTAAYNITVRFYHNFCQPHKLAHINEINSASAQFLSFLPETHLNRLIVTLFSTIALLKSQNYSNFGLDRLGTHPLENFNGYIRVNSRSKDYISSIVSLVSRAHLMKDFQRQFGKELKMRGRCNAGGLCLTKAFGIITIPDVDPDSFVASFITFCGIKDSIIQPDGLIDPEPMLAVMQWISIADAAQTKAEYQLLNLKIPRKLANNAIMTRNIQLSQK